MGKKAVLITTSALAAVFTSVLAFTPISALTAQDGVESAQGDGVPTTLTGANGVVTDIINILLFIVGIVSVIMLIIGGLRYVISGGNSATVTAAKNTILYAIVGLVIALFAYAIVNFVLDTLLSGGAGGGSGGGTNV